MSDLQEIVRHVYPYGGYHIRRVRGSLLDYVCCVHCKGTGEEWRLTWHSGRVAQQAWSCCVCNGRGYFQSTEEPPPACNPEPTPER